MKEEPSAQTIVDNYDLLFDPLMRAAHRAVAEFARLTEDDRWPTPQIVCNFAKLYGVPAADLGAFFGLLSYADRRRTYWIDAVRGPVHPGEAQTLATVEQARAWGFRKALFEASSATQRR